jgi:hypothetical protein
LADFSLSFLLSSGEGDMPSPAGVEMLSENIKSSRFMASEFSVGAGKDSEDFLNCAIPLGALSAFAFAVAVAFAAFCFDRLQKELETV